MFLFVWEGRSFKYLNITYVILLLRKMRRKTIRLIESIHSKGVFGPCACGGEVLYYTDQGVRCATCGKLYGVWTNRRQSLIKRAKDLLTQTQQNVSMNDENEKPFEFEEFKIVRQDVKAIP